VRLLPTIARLAGCGCTVPYISSGRDNRTLCSRRSGAIVLGLLIALSDAPQSSAAPARVDLPHAYYYREMFLPQLTSGPSGVAWSPDSHELVYSRAGSLWRQRLDSTVATQLTDGPGYDYQPDWSPDGRYIVYASERDGAIELCLLDLTNGKSQQLTHGGAVNVEPRWSPDGRQLVYVSTAYNYRFHIFTAEVRDGALTGVQRLTGENKSSLPRYYYSAYDHEISPIWTRDGQSIVFISNRGQIHGTGGFWRMRASSGAEPQQLHYEETNWRARPDFSPDGQRMVYSSYLGRDWLQLWLMPADGGAAFPLTYGDWDNTASRWSPDGRQIAFISNRHGDTELDVLRVPGAVLTEVRATELRRVRPYGTLQVFVRDERGGGVPARVSVTDEAGRFYAPEHAWVHRADFDRDEHPFEAKYFHTSGAAAVAVPAGTVRVDITRGFEHRPEHRIVQVSPAGTAEVEATLRGGPWLDGTSRRWVGGDVHVHMNYGGTYRNTPEHLVLQASAEDLSIVENLIVNKEQRIPDIAYSGRQLDPASTAETLIVHGQEFHTSYWGHLGLLNIRDHVLLPGYAGYPNTAAASLYPTNADVADLAHELGALVGYVHPFEEEPLPLTRPAHTDADELPVDVALGTVDYIEIVAFSDHKATAAVWYRLLNLGFHLPAAGGSDAMADYATLRGPVGMNRVYVSVPNGPLNSEGWLESLKQGRSFATNGPLLDFVLDDRPIGGTVHMSHAHSVPYRIKLRSIVPLDHAQIVCNGAVIRELPVDKVEEGRELRGTLPLWKSGWCVVRAFTARAEAPVLDNFVYATTSPIYVDLAGAQLRSPDDARFFVAWIDHLAETTGRYPDWNSTAERSAVLAELAKARAIYAGLE
jgi:Tol biopolymer transport system component